MGLEHPPGPPARGDLATAGWSRSKQAALWGAVVIFAGLFSALGFLLADAVGDVSGARLAAFTIGGLITMLTTSMVPFAYQRGGLQAGIWAVVGFGLTLASS